MKNKGIIVFLIVAACSVFVIFFTANDYQNNPDLFKYKKLKKLNSSVRTPENKMLDEYELGEYLYKNGDLISAFNHFKNVTIDYPEVPKSILKLNSVYYMRDISKQIKKKYYQRQTGSDTEDRIKKYYELQEE